MRLRMLTGVQRHRLTNALLIAGVMSALCTVTGSNILGCPAVGRNSRLDDAKDDDMEIASDRAIPTRAKELEGLEESRYVGGKVASQPIVTTRIKTSEIK
ncbi:hypothetical protein LPJ72_004103 [Coemansia sp. Benny D160-2]|nr:hypothetical protein LPJ72_004103 [Coemansia sp. Benny D160-2]